MNKKSFYNLSPPTSKNWELLFLNYQIIFLKKEKAILLTYIRILPSYTAITHKSLSCPIFFFIKPGLQMFLSFVSFWKNWPDFFFYSWVSFIYLHSIHCTKELRWFTLVSNRQLSGVDQMDTVYTTHYDKSFLLVRDGKLLRLP